MFGPSAFSSPPDPVLQTGVPGTAQGRARGARVALVGLEVVAVVGSVVSSTGIAAVAETLDQPRSEPLARYASEQVDGVRCHVSDTRGLDRGGEALRWRSAATTGTGLSEFRPWSTISRSACSGFVGMPVDGPARWMSRTSSGSSSATPSPTVSAFSTTPGPAEVVTPSAPPNAAPRAAPQAAISSSAWNVDAEVLEPGELLEDAGRGRDRVRAEEELQPESFEAAISP